MRRFLRLMKPQQFAGKPAEPGQGQACFRELPPFSAYLQVFPLCRRFPVLGRAVAWAPAGLPTGGG